MHKALEDTRKLIKDTGRPGVRKAVVVFANGKTGSEIHDLAEEAQQLHGNDVKVVSCGIGEDVSEEEMKVVANSGVILAESDQESEVIAQCIARQIDILVGKYNADHLFNLYSPHFPH